MSAVAGIPGLSQLVAWPTDHLTEAADHWEDVGARSYGVANQVWRDALSVDWHGRGAEALRTATHADMLTTSAVADQLQAAAKVARSGASDLYAARSRARYAVEDAHTAGFVVGEDLTVTDGSRGGSAAQRAARQAQAQALAADIRQRAAQLLAADQQVAGKVTVAMAGVRDTFPQNPSTTPPPPKIQAVDNHTFKQDPAPPPDPGAEPPWKKLPSPRTLEDVRNALRQLPKGRNAPVRQLETPNQIKDFWDWLTEGAHDLPPRGDTARRLLDDGTEINLRPDSESGGPTIEVVTPGSGKNPKVHLPLPFVDDPPELPPVLNHPPVAPAPPAAGRPLPTSLPPTQFPDPTHLPPWLQNPSPPGFVVSPAKPPPVFGWDRPDAPASHPAPPPPSGQSWLPEVGHDLSEGGKAMFGWVVVGGVLVWTILCGGGQGGEAAVP
ncbi:hypothetical protein [Mycobacterium sp. 852002-51057_SCH5723018]|uniref:hypothetical protein n=1 Tax=Mycobacterium sp. 852002-51057_SCH5723018 TaxID=1834094 RepID=UPI000801A01E|nr:hypothetical protein [Mycobacterium sp. 852002-51057_SCH5723018]OBG28972.1 hypothetical protein A5764_23690 [Mycobacterium sp. 852002-51057_SCH5723018]